MLSDDGRGIRRDSRRDSHTELPQYLSRRSTIDHGQDRPQESKEVLSQEMGSMRIMIQSLTHQLVQQQQASQAAMMWPMPPQFVQPGGYNLQDANTSAETEEALRAQLSALLQKQQDSDSLMNVMSTRLATLEVTKANKRPGRRERAQLKLRQEHEQEQEQVPSRNRQDTDNSLSDGLGSIPCTQNYDGTGTMALSKRGSTATVFHSCGFADFQGTHREVYGADQRMEDVYEGDHIMGHQEKKPQDDSRASFGLSSPTAERKRLENLCAQLTQKNLALEVNVKLGNAQLDQAQQASSTVNMQLGKALEEVSQRDETIQRLRRESADSMEELRASLEQALRIQKEKETQRRLHEIAEERIHCLHTNVASFLQECSCPIGQTLLRDPVVAADGHTYERDAIERWLSSSSTSPIAGLPLASQELVPNLLAARMAQNLREMGLNSKVQGQGQGQEHETQDEELRAEALLEATEDGDTELCLAILGNKVVPQLNDHTYSIHDGTILHWAAYEGNVSICKALLARPDFTEVNACDALNETALHNAAHEDQEDICRLLMQHEKFNVSLARSACVNFKGATAAEIAVGRGHAGCARVIAEFSE